MSDVKGNQSYGENGLPTDVWLSGAESKAGALHGSSHVWLWRKTSEKVEILLQKRSSLKSTWPDYWDISAAGHINFGESPLEAATRETSEEIGLEFSPDDLMLAFVFRTYMIVPSAEKAVENEFQFVYLVQIDEMKAVLQREEVAELAWVDLRTLRGLAMGGGFEGSKIVPHPMEYFANLTREITRRVG